MNEAIIAHHAQQHKLIFDSLSGRDSDDINERLYADDRYHEYRVPVTITRQGFMTLLAHDAQSAQEVANVAAAFADDIEDVVQTELIGRAEKV